MSVILHEVDRMYGTKGQAIISLYPDRAYIEIQGQLYNPTPLPQTFLWWANPAIAVNDFTQSIFPPDVHAVMDHGKRDVSKFPVATGIYYKHDYGAGVDISRYKNIPVPTSYMAYRSKYDFVGGYDHNLQAGLLHIADHHISPGKKQWTWGCGDFGKAWDRNLTDENGPYIELMTGVFTDNQPDFTWLKPFEEKLFIQYFLPYKSVAEVKQANKEMLVNMHCEAGEVRLLVYGTASYPNAKVVLRHVGDILFEKRQLISPSHILDRTIAIPRFRDDELTVSVYDNTDRLILSYTPERQKLEKLPDPAQPLGNPEEISTTEELYLAGQHIEQYHHATFLPDPYYREGLKRDPHDIRLNIAYGLLILRQGQLEASEAYFRSAISRSTWKNPNPYSGEAFYCLGLSLFYQERFPEAFDSFYKATWTSEQKEMSFYYLAAISMRKHEEEEALQFIEESLVRNNHNVKARALKVILLRLTGQDTRAEEWIAENLQIDRFDMVSRFESISYNPANKSEILRLLRNNPYSFMNIACDYAETGRYEEALKVLDSCTAEHPMIAYSQAFYHDRLGQQEKADSFRKKASGLSSLYCFPNKLEDMMVLEDAVSKNPHDSKALYYLGNLLYDKRQYGKARSYWEKSVLADGTFPTAWRNLSLVYYNKTQEYEKARQAMETAFNLDQMDARIFFELDQLYKRIGVPPKTRLKNYDAHKDLYKERDDLYTEYATLLNILGRYEQSYEMIMQRKFHPWEGGEGKVTSQYTVALRELGKRALRLHEYSHAIELFQRALTFPENLGEGKLEGAKDNDIHYLIGCSYNGLHDVQNANRAFAKATEGEIELTEMLYYNDQPAHQMLYQGLAFRALDQEKPALSKFHRLLDYGEKHMFDDVSIDYFAVSLPDLQMFDDDLTLRNKAHCLYLIGLGNLGLGNMQQALEAFDATINLDKAYLGAYIHRQGIV